MHNIHKSHTVFRRFDVPNPLWKRLRDAFECLHFVPSCQPAFFQRQARYVISHVPEGQAQVAAEVQPLNTLERDGPQHNRLLSPSSVLPSASCHCASIGAGNNLICSLLFWVSVSWRCVGQGVCVCVRAFIACWFSPQPRYACCSSVHVWISQVICFFVCFRWLLFWNFLTACNYRTDRDRQTDRQTDTDRQGIRDLAKVLNIPCLGDLSSR